MIIGLGCTLVHAWVRIPAWPHPSVEAQRWALAALDAASSRAPWPQPPVSARRYRAKDAIVVLGWQAGRPALRVEAGTVFVAAIEQAARHVTAQLESGKDQPWRWSVTVGEGEGPWLRALPWLRPLAVVPLREGVVARAAGKRLHRSPDELLQRGAYDATVGTPIADLRFGFDVAGVRRELAVSLAVPEAQLRLRRWRAWSFASDAYPEPSASLQALCLRRAVLAAVSFLLRHQQADGRFAYVYEPRLDRELPGPLSLARHAGTATFLLRAGAVLQLPAAQHGAARALDWLGERRLGACGRPQHRCVVDEAGVSVGATALMALALAELAASPQATARHRQWLAGTVAFLRAQQRADGELMHGYDLRRRQPIDEQRLYVSGEAALALLRASDATGDVLARGAALRLLHYLGERSWNFFGSRYYFGEEHWTCLAAREAHAQGAAVASAQALCRRWLDYNRVMQVQPGQTPWASAGAYVVGPLLPPLLTPTATRSEAAIALYGTLPANERAALRPQIEAGLGMLQRWQFLPGPTHLMVDAAAAAGGFPASPTQLWVRNDVVQHAASAMLQWLEVLAEPARGR